MISVTSGSSELVDRSKAEFLDYHSAESRRKPLHTDLGDDEVRDGHHFSPCPSIARLHHKSVGLNYLLADRLLTSSKTSPRGPHADHSPVRRRLKFLDQTHQNGPFRQDILLPLGFCRDLAKSIQNAPNRFRYLVLGGEGEVCLKTGVHQLAIVGTAPAKSTPRNSSTLLSGMRNPLARLTTAAMDDAGMPIW